MDRMDSISSQKCENPPFVTRGLDSQKVKNDDVLEDKVGIHWLRGSIDREHYQWVMDVFVSLFGSEFESNEFGYWRYDRHVRWPCGAMILFHSTETGWEKMNNRMAFEIPGQALESLDTWSIGYFLVNLSSRDFRPTRIDIYFDDMSRQITPSILYQKIYEVGLFENLPLKEDFSGFKKIKQITEGVKGMGLVHDEVAFGRRGNVGGQKYLRIYDKKLESKGENPAIRWELELSDKKAVELFNALVAAFHEKDQYGDIEKIMGNWIGGCIDFGHRTERTGDKNLSRLVRYDFWQLILNKIGRAKLVGRTIVRTVQKAKDWVVRISGTLQMLNKAYGPENLLPFLLDLASGHDRLREHHIQTVNEFRRQTGDNIPALQVLSR